MEKLLFGMCDACEEKDGDYLDETAMFWSKEKQKFVCPICAHEEDVYSHLRHERREEVIQLFIRALNNQAGEK